MGATMSIETFLLFFATFMVVVLVIGLVSAILAHRAALKSMKDFERRMDERGKAAIRRFRL